MPRLILPFSDDPEEIGKPADPQASDFDLILKSLSDVPTHVAASAAASVQGDVPAAEDDTGLLSRVIQSGRQATEERLKMVGDQPKELGLGLTTRDVAELPANLGYSISTGLAGLAGGAAGAPAGPAGMFAAGGAASYLSAYRTDKNLFLRDIRAAVDEEMEQKQGRPLSSEEWESLKQQLDSEVNIHSHAEAAPETIGNVAEVALWLSPLGRVLGRNVTSKLLTRVLGTGAVELGTETATQTLQQASESRLGLTPEPERSLFSPEDLAASAREVAPQTVLQTAFMSAAGGAASAIANRYRAESLMDRLPEDTRPLDPSPSPAPSEAAGYVSGLSPEFLPPVEAKPQPYEDWASVDLGLLDVEPSWTINIRPGAQTYKVRIKHPEYGSVLTRDTGEGEVYQAWVKAKDGSEQEWVLGEYDNLAKAIQAVEFRAQREFLEQEAIKPQTRTPEFRKWFSKSKVKDSEGNPRVVYHATLHNFDEFLISSDIGFHFGTRTAAQDRVHVAGESSRAGDERYVQRGLKPYPFDTNVMPVFLKIENPLRLPDLGIWEPHDVVKHLNFAGVIDGKRRDDLQDLFRRIPDRADRMARAREEIKRILQTAGYDGIVYANEGEGLRRGIGDKDIPNDSYIALEPEQIKSAVGNIGAFDPNDPRITASRLPSIYPEAKSRKEYEFEQQVTERLTGEVIPPWPYFRIRGYDPGDRFIALFQTALSDSNITRHLEEKEGTLFALGQFPASVRTRIMDTVLEAKRRYANGAKIVVTDGSIEKDLAKLYPGSKVAVIGQTLIDGSNGTINQYADGTYHITLNAPNFREEKGIEEVKLHSTTVHEMGHLIAFYQLNSSPRSLLEALHADYVNWVQESMNKTIDEVIDSKFAPRSAEAIKSYIEGRYGEIALSVKVRELGQENPLPFEPWYLLSPDEWMADQFVRYMSSPKHGLTILGRFWNRVIAILKSFHEGMLKISRLKGDFQPAQGFVKWLESVTTRDFVWHAKGKDYLTFGDEVSSMITALRPDGPSRAVAPPFQNPHLVAGQQDRWNRVMEWIYTAPQIAEQNPHISGLQDFLVGLEGMANYKAKMLHRAEETYKVWSNLGKERAQNVSDFLLEETVGGVALNLNDPNVIRQYRLDADSVEVVRRIKNDMDNVLSQFERVLTRHLIEELSSDPVAMQRAVNSLHTEMQRMRARPYFPLARFGNYTVVVRAKQDIILPDGKQVRAGAVFDMRSYPTEDQAAVGALQAKDDYRAQLDSGEVSVGQDYIEDVVFEFMGVPPQVLDRMEGELNLSVRQKKQLRELKIDLLPGRSFLKSMRRRRAVLGFSDDGERAYSSYMLRSANHLSRLQFYKQMSKATKEVADSATAIHSAGGSAVKRRKIHEYMAGTYDYIMNPGNEFAALRSAAFQFHLGFNVKSAVLNTTQLALMTFPKLSQTFGEGKVMQAMPKAMKQVYDLWKNPNAIPLELRQQIARGIDDGFIDQSFATLVASVAEGGVLGRTLTGSDMTRAVHGLGQLSAWMFSHTEKFNRKVTFVSAYNLAREAGQGIDEAYSFAKKTVRTTQGEYSKWARPKLFRGKRGALFIFQSYVQFMVYNFIHDPARVRMLLTMLVLGGVAGLPFAEDLMDIVDRVGSVGGRKFSSRKELLKLAQELVGDLGIKPDILLHGTSREFFGLPYFADKVGVPFPRLDMSKSIGLGHVIPGVEALVKPGSFNERVGRVAEDIGGAGIAIPMAMARAISEFDRYPNRFRAVEQALPSASRALAKAWRFYQEAAATDIKGNPLVEFNVHDPEQKAEIIASALGFMPTRLSEKYDERAMYKQHVEFFQTRREILLQDFAYARITEDREGVADARKAIERYNNEVPDRKLRVTGKDMRISLRRRMRNMAKERSGRPLEGRRYQNLYREIDELYTSDDEVIEAEIRRSLE